MVEDEINGAAEDNANERSTDTEMGATCTPVSSVDQLPPLLTPRLSEKKRQTLGGSLVVLSSGAVLVGLTHGIALTIGFDKHTMGWWIVFVLIYGTAVATLLCLVGLLVVDPGVVPRTYETCFPIPSEMNAWLAAVGVNGDKNEQHNGRGEESPTRPAEPYLRSLDEESGDTYCTRCLVWRRSCSDNKIRYFHCNICQRCVAYYDHHCDVLGRCIAGTTTGRGNLVYFYGMLAFGLLTYFTCLGSVLAGLVRAYDPKWVVPLFCGCVFLVHQCAPCYRGRLSQVRSFCLDLLLRKHPNR